ncbi:hypothetical protein PRI8871_03580 [Pseudoprimorskyibacter insulae]|uniref:Tripartite tricarboxylate transporter family receptor n=2 Tax=Pseudoprimorskyibacter insulae TaxID=1695997 RepID=A0A2R8B0D7_9RHOB|nr:hypothetical protein PRI8871_03580 [Pseudoprimorskyibacter insulae]
MIKTINHTLVGAALACAMTLAGQSATAEGYPDRTITIVVPYGAGGTTDVSARQIAQMAEAKLGTSIVVENRPGGSGTNAMRAVAEAAPDGYTLIASTSSPTFVTPALRPVGYDTLTDFIPLLNYSGPYHGVVVPGDSPLNSFDDLLATASGGKTLTYGTAGAMGGAHLAFAAMAGETGAALQHVPFEGSAAATAAVLGHHVDIALVPAYRDLVQDGQLKILAVLDGTRDPDFPDAPTLKDTGHDQEFPSIVGLFAPAGTDPAIVAKLSDTFTEVAASTEFKDFMTKLNQPVRLMSGEELAATIAENLETYRAVAAQMGLSK